MLSFSVSREGELVEVLALDQDIVKIGTLPSAHLRLREGAEVSRMHAVIECSATTRVIDLGSTTGTWVDGERVRSAALAADARVDIGAYTLELFHVDEGAWVEASGQDLAQERARICLAHGRRRLTQGGVQALEGCADALLLAWDHVRDPELPELLGDLRELLGVPREPLTLARTRPWLDARGFAGLDAIYAELVPRMHAAGGARWTRRAFELEICLQPKDDTPRRVYADWLLGRGDPRGEFIALQLAQHEGKLDARGGARLAQLWQAHEHEWAGAVIEQGASVEFRRGFVSRVERPGEWPEALMAACRPWRNLLDEATRIKAC